MADYIDRDELLKKIRPILVRQCIVGDTGFLDEIDKIIVNAPSVDAVEVVRCKDCKYRSGAFCRNFSKRVFDIGIVNHVIKDDDFCKWGEKE